MECARCHAAIAAGEDEACWYCGEPLCYACWDEHGHCGHARADQINKTAATGQFQALNWSEFDSRHAGEP